MTPPQITVVSDPDSRITQQLRTWNDPGQGIVVGMLRAGVSRIGWLANDLIVALGKTTGIGFGADGWAVASAHLVAWLVAEDIEHLVVGYAEMLPISQLVAITHLASLAEISLWVVADGGTTDTLAVFADEFGTGRIEADEFGHHLLATKEPRVSAADSGKQSSFPATVPEDTFLTFLAAARSTMADDAFSQVLELYTIAFDDTMQWLDEHPSVPTELDVTRHLSSLLARKGTLANVTTALRGVQAAGFRRGLLIRLDARRFLNRMTETRGAIDLHEEEWQLLSSNGNTRQCAIAVLAAVGMSVAEIHALPADHVAPDATEVRTPKHTYPVPEAARPLLLAQLLYRTSAGDPTDPSLLAGGRRDSTLTVRGVSKAIDELARTTGLAFRAVHDRWDNDGAQWRQRSGISITELKP